mmetsp:Transcript_3216/g.4273  ORF Transcript_3216/g.4273 Transcript_3216/m.4273 type:complete len:1023 (+) Transcript_3216:214-3282(+)
MQTRPTRTIFFFLIFFQLLSTLVLVQGFDLRSYTSGRIRIGLRQLLLAWRSNQDGVNTATGVGGVTPIIEASRAYFTNAGDDRDTLTILCISIRGGAAVDDSLSNSSHEEIPNSNQTKSIHSNTTTPTIANIDTATATKKKRNNRIKRQKDKSFESPSTTATSTSTFNSTQITEKISIWKNETTTKAKRIFLDKIAIVSTALLRFEKDAMVQNVTNKIQKRKMLYDYLKEKHQEDGVDDEHENEEDDDDEITLQSDLLRPGRSFYVVTTAAIPWFTGTAVNPLLRAAYLCRITREINEKYEMEQLEQQQESKEVNGTALNITATPAPTSTYQPKPRVTLVIPWLELEEDRLELYGNQYNFSTPQEQETYIRKWLREDANMPIEADEKIGLQIIFYPSRYHSGLKSIFAMGDIASLISSEKDDDDNNSNISNNNTDVCVLEEPEHLNWFRTPAATGNANILDNDEEMDAGPTPLCGNLYMKRTWDESDEENNKKEPDKEGNADKSNDACETDKKQHELGWAHKFKFVVGIIHTNYTAYMKQYGIGSSIIGAPAISAMSKMVVRAYCHKVVRLSAVIPSYAKWKEVTCNVHGVRGDFLGSNEHDDQNQAETGKYKDEDKDNHYAPIYFIGKLLWAKGFDKMLKIQEQFKDSSDNEDYFAIDVYGGGPDEKAIVRAFHGRLQGPSNSTDNLDNDQKDENDDNLLGSFSNDSVFSKEHSIKEQLHELVNTQEKHMEAAYKDAKNYINMGFEVVVPPEGGSDERPTPHGEVVVMERRLLVSPSQDDYSKTDPLSILTDVSGKSITAGIATTKAMKSLAESAVKATFSATFTMDDQSKRKDDGYDDIQAKQSFLFDPPQTLFELRRNPIPARFQGVKDHALLRDTQHKIFLNPSVTEVLCTTTAEALAMGKFVIIPNHPSNEFFLQFPNCLAYNNLQECVEKIKWALDHDPVPLTQELRYIFTWEAATDRLVASSIITKREAKERSSAGYDKIDSRMAWLHSEGGKKGNFIKNLFGKTEQKQEEGTLI